ncbi:hypothetical protein QL285_087987 [Trifolium repens]|nr:hypothetical protein QL285_087987 [Trifolium repens]
MDDIVKLLHESGFGGLTHLCKWTKIHTFFVEWIVKHFEKENMWIRLSKTDVLPLTEQDVHRVYGLPMSGEQINVDRCSEAAIKRLRKELGLVGNYSTFVKVTELEAQMKILEKPMSWVKGAICLIIHNILCPTNSSFVSLHYAQVLEEVASYNWCSHVLQYMKDGLQNQDVANPLADFHFLMINYMDKMGKRSPLLTGKQKFPSLRDWDVKTATQDLQKVHNLMGLEHGLTVGVKRLYRTDEGPLPMCFDPDTCPLSKAEEYLDHYRGCIQIYNGAVQTLERRIAEESGGTSAKQHAISQEQKGVEIAETEEPETKGEDDESEDGESEDGESEDSESDDAGGNSDVERVNNDANEDENDENDDESDESDENEDAKTISAEPRGVEVAESKEAEAETESGAGAETEVGESSDAQRFNNDQNEDDEEVEINAELLDKSVKAACNVGLTLTQETIEKFPQYFDGGETENAELNKIDSENKDSGSQAMDTVTQETILKFPQFFNSDLNKTDSVSQESDSVTTETILKYPEFFYAGEASTGTECSQSLALILYEAPPNVKHEDKSDPNICIDATPLRSVLPDEVIDVDNAEPVQKKKRRTHDMIYSSGAIPERKRPLKKSKYLSSPYDEAVHESKATKKQKDLTTYAWSDVHDK